MMKQFEEIYEIKLKLFIFVFTIKMDCIEKLNIIDLFLIIVLYSFLIENKAKKSKIHIIFIAKNLH